ncbi:hypothetical protein TPA0907_56160 [Micromonospora humidisoli]|nr:hypothetical protein TPA0907_56160 [Micromonospora sp. AKA109]
MTLLEPPVLVVAGKQLTTGAQRFITTLPEHPIRHLAAALDPGNGAPSAVHPRRHIRLRHTQRTTTLRKPHTESPLHLSDLLRIDHDTPTPTTYAVSMEDN